MICDWLIWQIFWQLWESLCTSRFDVVHRAAVWPHNNEKNSRSTLMHLKCTLCQSQGLCTLSPLKKINLHFKSVIPKKKRKVAHRNLALIYFLFTVKIHSTSKMGSSSSENNFVVLSLLEKKKKKKKYRVHPILKTRQEQEEFHLLIKSCGLIPITSTCVSAVQLQTALGPRTRLGRTKMALSGNHRYRRQPSWVTLWFPPLLSTGSCFCFYLWQRRLAAWPQRTIKTVMTDLVNLHVSFD